MATDPSPPHPSPEPAVAVAVCHRFALIRDGLIRILSEAWPRFEILAAADFKQYRLLKPRNGRLCCAIVESSLPGGGLPNVVGTATRHGDRPSVLAICQEYNLQIASETLALGADAVAALNTEGATLVSGVKALLSGRRSLHLTPVGPLMHAPGPGARLSPRERQVVGMVAVGMTNRQIAERLHIGVRSVDGYRQRAIRKANVTTKVELVAFARGLGLDAAFAVPIEPGYDDNSVETIAQREAL